MIWEEALKRLQSGGSVKRPGWECYLAEYLDGNVWVIYPNKRVLYRSYRSNEKAVDWMVAR